MHGYKINKHIDLLVMKFAGQVTIDQLGEVLMTVLTDQEYSLSMNTIADLRGMTSTFSYSEIQNLVNRLEYPGEIVKKTRSAILVDEEFTYGLGRIWMSITEFGDFAEAQIFWSVEEALVWLGIQPDVEIEFPF